MPDRYPHQTTISLRWKDNDVYGHVNNVEYYSFFDTVINEYLINVGGLDISNSSAIGVCAESHCNFKASVAFPATITAGMRVSKLGSSSVRYEIGLFTADDDRRELADGWFVHVFVDREQRRPTPIPDGIRAALERLT
jgi:acyl-CoA thioester hydrolase